MELMQHVGSILKIVIMPDDELTSPFQGFSAGLIESDFYRILNAVNFIPTSIYEIFEELHSDSFDMNLSRDAIYLLNKKNLIENINIFNSPFIVILYEEKDYKFSREISKRFKYKPILCGDSPKDHIKLKDVKNKYSFDNMLYKKVIELEKTIPEESIKLKLSKLTKRKKTLFTINKPTYSNNATKPNEFLVNNLGFCFSHYEILSKKALGSKSLSQ